MSIQKKSSQAEVKQQIERTPKIQPKDEVNEMRAILEKINDRDGMIGYVLRTSTSAFVDLKDPTKIIDYAGLSATAMEFGEKLSNAFELGKTNSIILEGKEVKMLSLIIREQRLSVFMAKSVDHDVVCKDLTQGT